MSLNDPDFPMQFLVGRELATRQNVDAATATRVAAVGSMLASGMLAPIIARQLAIREAPATTPVTAPALLSVAPNTGPQGQEVLDVTITGQNTNFTNASVISAGDGITVSNVDADNPTQLRARLAIAANATAGARAIKVTTGFEEATLANVFTVAARPQLVLIVPETGQPRDSFPLNILGRGTQFTDASAIDLEGGITATDVAALSTTQLIARITVAPDAVPGTRTLTVTSGTEVVGRTNAFTVSGRATVSISPNTAQQGQALDVTITAQGTHFTNATKINLEGGVTVANVVASSPTQLTAQLTIDRTATTGTRCITITSGTEEVHIEGAFTVTVPLADANVNLQLSEIGAKVNEFVKAQETQEAQDRAAATALLEKADRQKAQRTEALENLCHALGSFGGQSGRPPSKTPQSQSGPQAQQSTPAQDQTSAHEQPPSSQGRKGEPKP